MSARCVNKTQSTVHYIHAKKGSVSILQEVIYADAG